MINLKESLLCHAGFIENEFLEKYCRIIERNTRTSRVARITNSHHIIPKSWFKINKLPVDNNLTNLVNLEYRDHVLAHYYLCFCTTGPLQYANELAFICLTGRKKLNNTEKLLISRLPMYNIIYENCRKHRNYNIDLGGKIQ